MKNARRPLIRPRRIDTPLAFNCQELWLQKCNEMDRLHEQLKPLLDASDILKLNIRTLGTNALLGQPAYCDYMGAKRGSFRMWFDLPTMGQPYTVEHLADIRDGLAKTPDYIRRIKLGLSDEPAFTTQRSKIEEGLERLRQIASEMQTIAQNALDQYATSVAGQSSAGSEIVRQYVSPQANQIGA